MENGERIKERVPCGDPRAIPQRRAVGKGAEIVSAMNDIYRLQGLVQNHFSPSRKLAEKTKVNSKYVKKYDTPITPP